jgi:hypothetical protein
MLMIIVIIIIIIIIDRPQEVVEGPVGHLSNCFRAAVSANGNGCPRRYGR